MTRGRAEARRSPMALLARDRESLLDSLARDLLAENPDASREEIERHLSAISERFSPRFHDLCIAAGRRCANWMCHLSARPARPSFPWPDLVPTRVTADGCASRLAELARTGTLVLMPTHQSENDVLLFGYLLDRLGLPPLAWGVASSLLENRLVRFALPRFGGFAIERRGASALHGSALKQYFTELLRRGVHSLFFPGGGRVRSGAIETQLKLGLLGCLFDAQRDAAESPSGPRPIYVVAATARYDVVLEAPALIDEYLESQGIARPGHRRPDLRDALRAYWRFFGMEDAAAVTFADPVEIDPWGSLPDARSLAEHVARCFRRGNTVNATQLVAYALFEALRGPEAGPSLASLLRSAAAAPPRVERRALAERVARLHRQILEAASEGALRMGGDLREGDAEVWMQRGLARMSRFHEPGWIGCCGGDVVVNDAALLYYYRNRLAGYGLDARADRRRPARADELDPQGFLA